MPIENPPGQLVQGLISRSKSVQAKSESATMLRKKSEYHTHLCLFM